MMGTLHEDQHTFNPILLSSSYNEKCFRKICIENRNTHFVFSNLIFEYYIFYEKIWKNTAEPDKPHVTNWRMRFACWTPNATDTHTQNM